MTEVNVRKKKIVHETVESDAGKEVEDPVNKVVATAVIENPYAGSYEEDLSELAEIGGKIGYSLTEKAVNRLGGKEKVESYGKGALIGTEGEVEHGAAVLHPELGGAMREAIGGGESIIPSVRKVGNPGETMDIPTHHKDDVYQLSHFDTTEVSIQDAPREKEIVVAVVLTDGGRPHPRIEGL